MGDLQTSCEFIYNDQERSGPQLVLQSTSDGELSPRPNNLQDEFKMRISLLALHFRKDPSGDVMVMLLAGLLAVGNLTVLARQDPQPTSAPSGETQDATRISNQELDALVSPIALYPDPLLGQVLVASTYPLEIMQLQQWLTTKGSVMEKEAMTAAIQQLDLDASIQAMAVLPDVLKQMADNITWTSDLGNAFLAQQTDVMDAVQRMRVSAKNNGSLKSNEQMRVEERLVESKNAVVIEQTDPDVVYVPSYNPSVVWGVGVYAYPPFYYPPVGYYGVGVAIGFGIGIAVGVAWVEAGVGAVAGEVVDININRNNNFVRNSISTAVISIDPRRVVATSGSIVRSIGEALLIPIRRSTTNSVVQRAGDSVGNRQGTRNPAAVRTVGAGRRKPGSEWSQSRGIGGFA
jgi:hypothetical protein